MYFLHSVYADIIKIRNTIKEENNNVFNIVANNLPIVYLVDNAIEPQINPIKERINGIIKDNIK